MPVIFKIIVSVLKRTEVESVLITRIDVVSQVTTFSVDEWQKEVKNTKPKNVQHDLCPNPPSFFWCCKSKVR